MIEAADDLSQAMTAEVRAFEALNVEGLRQVWRRRYGPPPRLRSADLMRRLLTWRIQAEAFGEMPTYTREALTQPSVAPGPKLTPGTRLTREWRGVRHEVEITVDGVAYAEQTYVSLSEVARTITGTRWNGPRFFGLRTEVRR